MDASTRERIVRELTEEILRNLRQAAPGDSVCECRTDCIHRCPDRLRGLVECGAERFGIQFGAPPVANDLSKYIDHTLLKPDASETQIRQLCKEAGQFRFAAVVSIPRGCACVPSFSRARM